jgi:hypothetical protein
MTSTEKILEVQPLRNELKNQRDIMKAINIPIRGARKIKLTVLRITAELTASIPAAATPAPANPPISV